MNAREYLDEIAGGLQYGPMTHPASGCLVDALRAVLDLHKPVEVEPSDTICGECSHEITIDGGPYFTSTAEWPCETVQAIEAKLGGES